MGLGMIGDSSHYIHQQTCLCEDTSMSEHDCAASRLCSRFRHFLSGLKGDSPDHGGIGGLYVSSLAQQAIHADEAASIFQLHIRCTKQSR